MRNCTRAKVHVDRCASAWLIRRFIDSEAEFVFVAGQTPVPDTIPFDMVGVEWGHHDNRCTFEQIIHLHRIQDRGLQELARIIHGADITADADETLESPGMDLLFRGLRKISTDDNEAIERGCVVMDALYAALSDSDEYGNSGSQQPDRKTSGAKKERFQP